MIEKAIKDEYRLGTRKGVTELDECFYLPVRITGTGLNLREKDGETIVADRAKVDYFSSAFIEHAKTLPIIVEHPKEGMLESSNLKDNPIVGNCIDAWIEKDELWGLARVFDKTLLQKFGKEINSTSPAVTICYEPAAEAGIEKEVPISVNHLAFVDKGHWDNNAGSIGFDNSKIEKISVEEEKVQTSDADLSKNDIIPKVEEDSMVDEKLAIAADAEKAIKDSEAKGSEEKVADEEAQKVADESGEKKVADEEIEEVSDDEVEELSDKDFEQLDSDEIADIPISDKVEEVSADEAETEVIDSETETDEDKSRDDAVDEMRAACDSAHASLGVKMPHIKGRQTMRSVVNKFVQQNRKYLNGKYANLAVDSYTKELAKEVLADTLANIRKESAKFEDKKEGFVDTGKGYSTLQGFGWKNRQKG